MRAFAASNSPPGFDSAPSEHTKRCCHGGKTIEDALHFYLAHLEKTKTSAPLQKAIDELIKVRREGGRSDVYCYDLKLRLGRFSGDFSDKTTSRHFHCRHRFMASWARRRSWNSQYI